METIKREISREGWYTKYHNSNEDEILSFVARSNKNDNFFKVLEMVREKQRYNGYQCCKAQEENKHFGTVFFIQYNLYGQPRKGIFLYFDFEAETVTTEEGKTYKVIDDDQYTYRIQKTQIRATNGIKGFYSHIVESMHVDSAFNTLTFRVIEKL